MNTTPTAKRLNLTHATAENLMTPNPVSIDQDAPVAEAIALLAERECGAAPVIDEAGHPVGVISRTDVLVHERERGPEPLSRRDPDDLRPVQALT